MQDPSIHRQNSWVNDLNDSVQEFQRKDKWARILKITFFSVCATILLLSIFIWSSGRLFFVFPEVDSIESLSDLKKELDNSNELQEIINNEALLIPKVNPIEKNSLEGIIVPNNKKAPPSINYLKKYRPKNTLNAPKSVVNKSEPTIEKNDIETKNTFYASGKKWLELNYQKGQQHGRQFGWYENGNQMYELNYVNGKKNGKQIWWDKSGKITTEKMYRNGEWLRQKGS